MEKEWLDQAKSVFEKIDQKHVWVHGPQASLEIFAEKATSTTAVARAILWVNGEKDTIDEIVVIRNPIDLKILHHRLTFYEDTYISDDTDDFTKDLEHVDIDALETDELAFICALYLSIQNAEYLPNHNVYLKVNEDMIIATVEDKHSLKDVFECEVQMTDTTFTDIVNALLEIVTKIIQQFL